METVSTFFNGVAKRKGSQTGIENPQNFPAREASGEPVTEEERQQYLRWKKMQEEKEAKSSRV